MIGVQAAMNSILGKRLGLPVFTLVFSLLQFAASIVPVLLVVLWQRSASERQLIWHEVFQAPPWLHIGAALGVFILMGLAFGVSRIGAFAGFAGVLLGQLLAGMIIDHYGFFGTALQPLSAHRLIGLVFLFLGVWFAPPR